MRKRPAEYKGYHNRHPLPTDSGDVIQYAKDVRDGDELICKFFALEHSWTG